MNKSKRTALKALTGTTAAAWFMPARWSTPLINAVVLPVHAQTSDAPRLIVEPVDGPISITITATEVRGPLVATLNGNSFTSSEQSQLGQCGTGSDNTDQTITFSGQVDSANNQIRGDFLIEQFCGGVFVCEQEASFVADQVTPDPASDLGEYTGRVVGTLTCSEDFL